MVASTTDPLGGRDSTLCPSSTLQQRTLAAENLERLCGLWWRSFRHFRSRALQGPLRLFAPNTAREVRRVVVPAARALRFLPCFRAPTGDLGPPHTTHWGSVSIFTLGVSEAMAAPAFQWAICITYGSIETSKLQMSVINRNLDTSGLNATDIINWGWEGSPWRGSGRDGRNTAS